MKEKDVDPSIGSKLPPTNTTVFDAFKRNFISILILVCCLAFYFLLESVQMFGSKGEIIGHVILTIAIVLLVHLIDRIWLFRDTKESLDDLRHHITSQIANETFAVTSQTKQFSENQEARLQQVLDSIAHQADDLSQRTDKFVHYSASLEAMVRCGILRVFSSRGDVGEDLAKDLTQPNNTKIRLMGVSLNDFVQSNEEELGKAWQILSEYVQGTRKISPAAKGLEIKVLMIDPLCYGATLRAKGEARSKRSNEKRLFDEVTRSAEELRKLELFAQHTCQSTKVSFECRMYRLPPILFLCQMDHVSFVQQYYFWASRQVKSPTPIIKYRRHPILAPSDFDMHAEMENHFEWIWSHASVPISDYLEKHSVGTDSGLLVSGCTNIFTNPTVAEKRMLWCLEQANNTVKIQGISLHSFFSNGPLFDSLSKLVEADQVVVQVLFLDPESKQAKLRSFREQSFAQEKETFPIYEASEDHKHCSLVKDTKTSIAAIKRMVARISQAKIEAGIHNWAPKIEVRIYDSAPSCFLLQIDNTTFVEQYHYGKIMPEANRRRGETILGKDMPLMEFSEDVPELYRDRSDPLRMPFSLLSNHFEFVFLHSKQVSL